MSFCDSRIDGDGPGLDLAWKLWIYTNYDCNLSCTYCLASSTPHTPRLELSLEVVKRLVDEAVGLGFDSVYFTGGEPLLLESIYEMLAYASARLPTTLLTNAMLARGKRLQRLGAAAHPNLTVQVSLDGGRAETHDAYRGKGSWVKTVEGIRNLQARGLRVRLSTTETPANQTSLAEICTFHQAMGIAEKDHFIRPLARRGAAQEGLVVSRETLAPEITVSAKGVYWHPLSTDEDMRIREQIFPLSEPVRLVLEKLQSAQALQTVK
jgi:MoaA/NifB/PqqE/SkfB family radical SAM enzyme